MFGRRIFASAPIPPSMYAKLNISSAQQAQRRLPSLVPVTNQMTRSLGTSSLVQLLTGAGGGLAVTESLVVGGGSQDALVEQISLLLASATIAKMACTVNPCLWSDYSKVRTMMKCCTIRTQPRMAT